MIRRGIKIGHGICCDNSFCRYLKEMIFPNNDVKFLEFDLNVRITLTSTFQNIEFMKKIKVTFAVVVVNSKH